MLLNTSEALKNLWQKCLHAFEIKFNDSLKFRSYCALTIVQNINDRPVILPLKRTTTASSFSPREKSRSSDFATSSFSGISLHPKVCGFWFVGAFLGTELTTPLRLAALWVGSGLRFYRFRHDLDVLRVAPTVDAAPSMAANHTKLINQKLTSKGGS
jgi:hypothetical protein